MALFEAYHVLWMLSKWLNLDVFLSFLSNQFKKIILIGQNRTIMKPQVPNKYAYQTMSKLGLSYFPTRQRKRFSEANVKFAPVKIRGR